jgi:hypothetical protein
MFRISMALILLGSSLNGSLADELRAPRASVYVPLRFDGNPIRVIVSTNGRPPRSVRWAVGELDKSLQIERTIDDVKRLAPPETPSEVLDEALDELLRAQRPALHFEIHNGVPKWQSWNHKVDRRSAVEVIIHGTKQSEDGERESWAGIEVTARPYGEDVLVEVEPYYTEFEEAKGRRRGDLDVSFIGPPRRRGKMVAKPADIEALKKLAALKFAGDEEQSANTDPDATKREWASLLATHLQIIELQRGIPLRFYIGDETLEAAVESE